MISFFAVDAVFTFARIIALAPGIAKDTHYLTLTERHPERKEERIKQELYDAYLKNDKSLEEIIQLIENTEILEYLDWT